MWRLGAHQRFVRYTCQDSGVGSRYNGWYKDETTDHLSAATYDGILERYPGPGEPRPQRGHGTYMLNMPAADEVLPSSRNHGLNPIEVPARIIRRSCGLC